MAQTQAICLGGFEWMQNDAQDSPCLLAAKVIAPCSQSGAWNIPALSEGNHYNPPSTSNDTDTDCYWQVSKKKTDVFMAFADAKHSSWAAYNLLNACAACQNNSDGITSWLSFKQDCGSHVSTSTYFPPNISLAGNSSLPFYATVDPSTWQDEKFNVQQAQLPNFANQPDVNPATQAGGNSTTPQPPDTPSPKKMNVGAIAGGVVGAVVVLALSALLAFWLIRRQRKTRSEDGIGIVKPGHERSLSDMTQSTYPQPSDFPYSQMASPGPFSIHTHESDPATISRFGSIYTTPPHGNSPTRGPSPISSPSVSPSLRMSVASAPSANIGLGFQPMAVTPESPNENVIRPFIVNQHTVSQTSLPMNRKGPINLQYDSPNSPPVNRAEDYFGDAIAESASRPQMNPPAYTPYPATATDAGAGVGAGAPSDATTPTAEVVAGLRERNGHSHRPRPEQKGSFDTETPWTSTGSRVVTTATTDLGPSSGETTITTPVSPSRHVVNASVISGPDDGPEIA
ncbi:hypothetical protein D9758_012829 [Tetrapyrgos nigripes]|uniref:Uncharacterized protein n=1 Tax=Tetrapyrgos nigripes TaxID=182062 RepID=A0A8H5CCI8_9AGAR|nr:hypothetical protein D9758_012829 [Tetrapyrgos nigripes]